MCIRDLTRVHFPRTNRELSRIKFCPCQGAGDGANEGSPHAAAGAVGRGGAAMACRAGGANNEVARGDCTRGDAARGDALPWRADIEPIHRLLSPPRAEKDPSTPSVRGLLLLLLAPSMTLYEPTVRSLFTSASARPKRSSARGSSSCRSEALSASCAACCSAEMRVKRSSDDSARIRSCFSLAREDDAPCARIFAA